MTGELSNLTFTGNWFFDAGLIGFVRIFEDVFNLSFEDLDEEIGRNERLVYLARFPVAYFCHYVLSKYALHYGDNISDFNSACKSLIGEDLDSRIKKLSNESDDWKLFSAVWDYYVPRIFKEAWIASISKKMFPAKKKDKQSKKKKKFSGYPVFGPVLAGFMEKLEVYLDELNSSIKLKDSKRGYKIVDLGLPWFVHGLKNGSLIISWPDELINLLRDMYDFLSVLWEYIFDLDAGSKDRLIGFIENIDELTSLKKNFLEYISKYNSESNTQLKSLEEFLRLPLDSNIFKNFLFFNTAVGFYGQKIRFFKLVNFDLSEKYLSRLDKTVNKFMYSSDKFSNIPYTVFTTEPFKETYKRFFVHIICFDKAFQLFRGFGYYFFYSLDPKFTYDINKRFWVQSEHIEEKSSRSVLSRTWRELIVSLQEKEAEWVLENLYIIKYVKIDNQEVAGVEYFGLDKARARILRYRTMGDQYVFLDALNSFLRVSRDKTVWLLEEFTKNQPLSPLIILNMLYAINNRGNRDSLSLLGSSRVMKLIAIDSVLYSARRYNIFDSSFLEEESSGFLSLSERLEKTLNGLRLLRNLFTDLIEAHRIPRDALESYARVLLDSLLAMDKYLFINTLFRLLNRYCDLSEHNKFSELLEKYIIGSDVNWFYNAVLITSILLNYIIRGFSTGDYEELDGNEVADAAN